MKVKLEDKIKINKYFHLDLIQNDTIIQNIFYSEELYSFSNDISVDIILIILDNQ